MTSRSLHSCSSSIAGTSSPPCDSKKPLHRLTTTSIKQKIDLEYARLLNSSRRAELDWMGMYSLEALQLTLDHIMEYCRLPRQEIMVEFPFSQYLTVLSATGQKHPSPSKPQTNVDKKKLAEKLKELKVLIRFYKDRIHWLSVDSRLMCGLLKGSSIAMVVEASQCLSESEVFQQYKVALKQLVEEQLMSKKLVYFIKYGNSANPTRPQGLPFTKFKAECTKCATDWIDSLEGDNGGANLLQALKLALELPDIDTLCVILSTRPNQPLDVIRDYMMDKLSGEDAPKLHLVALDASNEIHQSLSNLAKESHGHFHSHSLQGDTQDSSNLLREDSDINRIREEIVKAQAIRSELKNIKYGNLGEELLQTLRELSLTTQWEKDDDFPIQTPPTGDHCMVCSTSAWLVQHGIEGQNLNLYKHLAPNAYPQLGDYVEITSHYVVSQVYNVMPLIPWEDGSLKYLHVDVHGLEAYLATLEDFMVSKLLRRLSWLQCGSRVPFGMILEPTVLLVVDSSHIVLGQVLKLQQHFKMLLMEQLAHVEQFNLVGCGRECRLWTTGFAEPNRQSLKEAWEWILEISPSGSNDLLSSLKAIFESGAIFEDCDKGVYEIEESAGIYLVMSSLPNQHIDILCSYIEQVTAGHSVSIHVIYYDTEPLANTCLYPGTEGGRVASDEEMESCLRKMSVAGMGRFHHFRISGACVGDELELLLEEIAQATEYLEEGRRILNDYREFCRRNVRTDADSSFSQENRHTPAPPLYPRQTISSLARMNVCSQKVDCEDKIMVGNKKGNKYTMKDQFFYTGIGLRKAKAWELVAAMPPRTSKSRSLIPGREEYISSKQWIGKYGLETLRLSFGHLISKDDGGGNVRKKTITTYKHINHQGEVVELCVDLKGLKDHTTKLQKVLKRYRDRLQWLDNDENRYFGTILEREVVFLLDVSTSMSRHLNDIREKMTSLLSKLPPKTKRFNLIAFSTSVQCWQGRLVSVNKESIADALQWLDNIQTEGNSYLLQALKESLELGAIGIYLITDGASDHTHDFLLNQLPFLHSKFDHDWRIHTIGWHCSKSSQDFLQLLSCGSGGRFHRFPETVDGDDYVLIAQEISLTQESLKETNNYL